MKAMLRDLSLNTVCEGAACPNISECFNKGTATFMILGNNCTRNCRFCNIDNGRPSIVDDKEPDNIAEAVVRLGLKHVVITSVTRDDLSDGGSTQFANTIKAIRTQNKNVKIEVLIPDFNGSLSSLKTVLDASPDILNHNLETVSRIYSEVRPQGDFFQSLDVLRAAKKIAKTRIYTKSGLMVGLGETEEEVVSVMLDLKLADCDFLSIGQYLSPSKEHYPVKEYIEPKIFDYYKDKAMELGFLSVASAPYVRSSYLADEYWDRILSTTTCAGDLTLKEF